MVQNTNKQKMVTIVGPTASGKSDLGIKIAKKFNGEIISADSRQVYKDMDIGTGKVSKKEQKIVKHCLLDVVSPKKQFTADDFKRLGEKAIEEIADKGKMPIIVGGTGFYIDVLLGRMNVAEVPPNKKLRAKLEKQSTEQLFKRLSTLNPLRSSNIDRHNKRRLIRALEIVLTTGKPTSNAVVSSKYNVLWLGMSLDKKELTQKIKKRLDVRLKQSMIKEVENLHKHGVSWKRLDDLGLEYRQISEYLKNSKFKYLNPKQIQNSKLEIQNFKNSEYYEKLLREIIKYSKRQITWFKRNKEIHWIENDHEVSKLISNFMGKRILLARKNKKTE